jgi:hypothetical protein
MRIVREIGMDLSGSIVSLDGVYDCRANRKAIFNRGMVPNINPNPRARKQPKRGRKPIFQLVAGFGGGCGDRYDGTEMIRDRSAICCVVQ